jgi:hypothetical protein
MPDFMVPASVNQAGGMVSRKPRTAGGPWEITQQQDIGASNTIDPRLEEYHSSDPRCQCVRPYDPRTEVR